MVLFLNFSHQKYGHTKYDKSWCTEEKPVLVCEFLLSSQRYTIHLGLRTTAWHWFDLHDILFTSQYCMLLLYAENRTSISHLWYESPVLSTHLPLWSLVSILIVNWPEVTWVQWSILLCPLGAKDRFDCTCYIPNLEWNCLCYCGVYIECNECEAVIY